MSTSARPSHPFLPVAVASVGGVGFSPLMPGTAGTLVAIPLAWALARAGTLLYVLALIGIVLAGMWAADRACRVANVEDPQFVVIDEVAGYLLGVSVVPATWPWLLAGFVLFRVFDIWKPWPVRWADERVKGGLGVMLDDLLAGLYTALLLAVARLVLG